MKKWPKVVWNSVKYQNFYISHSPRDQLYLAQPKKAAFDCQKWKYRTIFHKKVVFLAVFEGQIWANYRNYLELPKKNHLKPHTFLKIHTLTSSKMLKLVWFYLGNSKKSWISFSSWPLRKCLGHPRKTPKSSIFFIFSSIATRKPWYLTKFRSHSWTKSICSNLCI